MEFQNISNNSVNAIIFKFFLWIIYTLGNIRAVSHIKTWYSSKCPNTTVYKNIPGGKNGPMPPCSIILIAIF